MEADIRHAYQQEAADRDFFATIPWVAKFISSHNLTYYPMLARLVKASGEDAFLAETVKTTSTIPYLLCYYRQPATSTGPVEELFWFLKLESKLNGWPDLLHGGIQSFLLDEVMGCLLGASKRINLEKYGGIAASVTGELKVRFVGRIDTPGVYMARARLLKVEGRKCYCESDIVNEAGDVLVKAEAVFIVLKEDMPRL